MADALNEQIPRAAAFPILIAVARRLRRKNGRKRAATLPYIDQGRQVYGAFHTLVQEMADQVSVSNCLHVFDQSQYALQHSDTTSVRSIASVKKYQQQTSTDCVFV